MIGGDPMPSYATLFNFCCYCKSHLTHLLNAVFRLVYTLFFQCSAEVTKCKDGGRPNVVLQVVRTEPGLKKKVGSV